MASTYTQDVEFNSAFGVLQTPVHIFTACMISGVQAPDVNKPFRYLDLACGNGLTLALLADAYPHAQFVGIDINPQHIARAKLLAETAKLSNITFLEGDILSLDAAPLGQFDYAAVSGVYSWLDPDRRLAVRELMSSVLVPGGLLCIDYSAQPGMAQTSALYQLLQHLAASVEGSSSEKLLKAAKLADQSRQNGSRFFEMNKHAASRLEAILRNPAEDEAHEVLNLQGTGFWSGDVINDMKATGFEFAADIGLHHNLAELCGDPELHDTSDGKSLTTRQILFDVKRNVPHRRDVYVRGGAERLESLLARLQDYPLFYTRASLQPAQRKALNSKFINADLCSEDADTFVEAVLAASTFAGLFQALKDRAWPDNKVHEYTRIFMALRLISISIASSPASENTGRLVMATPLNDMILTQDIGERHVRPFSSPVVGTRVLLPIKDRLYLWGLLGLDLSEAWDKIGDLRSSFLDANNKPVSQEAFIEIIKGSLPGFRKMVAPELLRLKILKEVPA